MPKMFKSLFGLLLCGLMGIGALSAEKASTNQVATVAKDLFQEGLVPRLRIEIPPDSMKVLRAYRQNHEWPRPVREDVLVTIREGKLVYTNVAVHLKGSYSFRPINDKPGLTLHFD